MEASENPVSRITEAHVKAELWRRGNLSFKLDSLQRHIRDTCQGRRKVCILSSRQIGKSYSSCAIALEFLIKNPGKIARIIAPTLKQCSDIVQDNLIPITLDAPPGMIERVKSEYRWHLANGSSLRLGALDRAHVDGNRGGNASLVIYEECGFVSAEDFSYGVDSVLGPQLLRSAGVEMFVSSPSEDPEHPLHIRILPQAERDGAAFVFTVFDSPSISPHMIIEAMERSGCQLTPRFAQLVRDRVVTGGDALALAIETGTVFSEAFQREYLAMIIRPSTLMIVPTYDEHRHVAAYHLPLSEPLQVTIDWGGTRDMTVALLHTYDHQTDRLLVWDERHWPANTPTSVIVRELLSWESDAGGTVQRTADVPGQVQVDLIELGYEIQQPSKADWLGNVQALATLFARDRVLIHPRCELLRRTCKAGIFNKNRTDFERIPGLGHCDAVAALMYANRAQRREFAAVRRDYGTENFFTPPSQEKSQPEVARWGAGPKLFGRFRDG